MDSSSTVVAHRDGRFHQRSGGTPTRARVPNSFVPTNGAICHGNVGDSLAACCALALSAHFAPGWRTTHVLWTPFERHRLVIRQGDERGTASGRIGHHCQCRRLRPLQRSESAACHRLVRTQVGACFENHIGSVGLSRPEGAGLVIGWAVEPVGP